mmetsp:Transcript_28082/g.70505  ORF Transcript_28082/g.70505 Transcript_28082/m.70505 type:complete len:332 (-) Transcript_28082:241-1236(-)
MDGATASSEFLCTLQPPSASDFARGLLSRRAACRQAGFELDSTELYPPHVSVTGFFKATQNQAAEICAIISTELAAALAPAALPLNHEGSSGRADASSECVKVQQVVTTEGGHVLLDVVAPLITSFAQVLAKQAACVGVHVRPKAVRHLSLASGRSPEQRAGIARLYEGIVVGGCCWDLVVSRLLFRSDLEKLRRDGDTHAFEEVLRVKLPCAAKAQGESLPGALMSKIDAVAAAAAPSGRVLQADYGHEHEPDCRGSVESANISKRGMDSSPRRLTEDQPTKDGIAEHFANSVARMQKHFSGAEVIRAGPPKEGRSMVQVAGKNSMLCVT